MSSKQKDFETVKYILSKTAMLLKNSLLKSCGKFPVCHPKMEVSAEKRAFAFKK